MWYKHTHAKGVHQNILSQPFPPPAFLPHLAVGSLFMLAQGELHTERPGLQTVPHAESNPGSTTCEPAGLGTVPPWYGHAEKCTCYEHYAVKVFS